MKRFLKTTLIIAIAFSWIFDPLTKVNAQSLTLPKPGTMVHLSKPFNPTILKGIKVYPDNPFRFDFVLSQGDQSTDLKDESDKLVKYFLAALTIPEKDLWVNLSPYEKDRIVPESFGQTQMGRDLLAQDYMLKQITASLIYPDGEVGKIFWKKIYQQSANKNIPVATFNKVWIVPNKAVIYENAKAGTAYVVESSLKVMTEQDYVATNKNTVETRFIASQTTNKKNQNIIKDIVIPQLNKEVNTGENFAQLRQVYNAFILATWYKQKIHDSIFHEVYNNQNKINGLQASKDLNVDQIYQSYLQAFKKGTYNFIREEQDPLTQQSIPRKYFSGGVNLKSNFTIQSTVHIDPAQLSKVAIVKMQLDANKDEAMVTRTVVREYWDDLSVFLNKVKAAKQTLHVKEETHVVDDSISRRVFELVWKPLMQKLDEYRDPELHGNETAAFKSNTRWFGVMYRFAQLEVAEGGWFLLPTMHGVARRLKKGADIRVDQFKALIDQSRKIYLLSKSYDPSRPLIIIIRGAYAPPKFYSNFYNAAKQKYNVAYFEYNEFADVEKESENFLNQLEIFLNANGVKGKYGIFTHSHGGVISEYAKVLARKQGNPIFELRERVAVAPVHGGSAKALVYDSFLIRSFVLRFVDGMSALLQAHYPRGSVQQALVSEAVLDAVAGKSPKGLTIYALNDPHNVVKDPTKQEGLTIQMKRFESVKLVFSGHQESANDPEAVGYALEHFDSVLKGDKAMTTNAGGIDFNGGQLALSLQKGSRGIKMKVDPKMIEQLKHISGFVPVILDIQSLKTGEAGAADLRFFLGLP